VLQSRVFLLFHLESSGRILVRYTHLRVVS